jgi:hypothetical protein
MSGHDIENKWNYIADLNKRHVRDVIEYLAKVSEELAHEVMATRRNVSMQGVRGAPDWLTFETDLWRLSEELRHVFQRHRTIRGGNPLLDALARIAVDQRFGKGRQNIVLLLGEYGQNDYGHILGHLLTDPDVYGHAIKALTRAKIKGYADRVLNILQNEKNGWVRAAARKYLSLAN